MANERTAVNPAPRRQRAITVRRRHSEGALAWCQFAFSVACVGAGVALCFTGFPIIGGPLITAAATVQIKVDIHRR